MYKTPHVGLSQHQEVAPRPLPENTRPSQKNPETHTTMASPSLQHMAPMLIQRCKTLLNKDLQKICKQEGMPSSGVKAQLQARIIDRTLHTHTHTSICSVAHGACRRTCDARLSSRPSLALTHFHSNQSSRPGEQPRPVQPPTTEHIHRSCRRRSSTSACSTRLPATHPDRNRSRHAERARQLGERGVPAVPLRHLPTARATST